MSAGLLRFVLSGWITKFYETPTFFFHYWGIGPVPVLTTPWMTVLYLALAVLAVFIAVGFFYRLSAVLFFLGFTYTELLDVTNYLNHYYLVSLVAALFCILPLHQTWSIDAIRNKNLREKETPRWVLVVFRSQIFLVYFFAGLAKLQPDWLLHAQPLGLWFSARTETPLIGNLLATSWFPYAASWFAAFYDLTIVGWLMLRRTRPVAMLAVVLFHTLTAVFFNIGLFPYLMTAFALAFFPTSWPRQWVARIGSRTPPPLLKRSKPLGSYALCLWAFFLAVQVAMPLRHYFYPGNVLWNEDGMRFSWKVMIREKHGSVDFRVRLKDSERDVRISPRKYLTRRQEREMAGQPDLILQLAHHIGRQFQSAGHKGVSVFADTQTSLNGRKSQPLVDPEVDLMLVDNSLRPSSWVLPAPQEAPFTDRNGSETKRASK